jgi:transposase
MKAIYYIGLDMHKKTIVYCIKKIDGALVSQGTVASERKALLRWLPSFPAPGTGQWRHNGPRRGNGCVVFVP